MSSPRRERIDMAVFGVAPGFARATIRLRGIDPTSGAHAARALLQRAGQSVRTVSEALTAAGGTRSPAEAQAAWQEAYTALGVPPEVVPPHVALQAWAMTSQGVPTQLPVLDLVNAFSLQHGVPTAAYDLDLVEGDLWLRPSRGHEAHAPISGPAGSPPLGELILADSADRVLARHWHGSPGLTGIPGPTSVCVLVHVDLLDAAGAATVADAALTLGRRMAGLARGYLGGEAEVQVLSARHPHVTWSA